MQEKGFWEIHVTTKHAKDISTKLKVVTYLLLSYTSVLLLMADKH